MKREPRQLNVQQQNARTEESVRSESTYWREHGVPEALRICGEQRGVQWHKAIVVGLDQDFPGMPSLFGVLLTQDERFIRFEIDTESDVQVYQWEDITAAQNLNEHNRGTGVGYGALAIKILRHLNA